MTPPREIEILVSVCGRPSIGAASPRRRFLVVAHAAALCSTILLAVTPAGAEEVLTAGAVAAGVPARPMVPDIRLTKDGSLTGYLVTDQSAPVVGALLQLHGPRQDAPRTARTDQEGRFEFTGLSTGVVQVACGSLSYPVRIWDVNAAPPCATERLVWVQSPTAIVRGQQPIGNLFCNEPIMIGVLVAAAIAIPLALHDSGDQADGS